MMRRWGYNLHGSIEQDKTLRYVPQDIDAPLPVPKPLKAVVLVAGKGNRLRPLTEKTPKPLLHAQGTPLLEYILDGLHQTGINEICLIVGYLEEQFRTWVKDVYLASSSRSDIKIDFITQTNINGTGGAVLLAKEWVGESYVLVTYGDILMSWSVYDRMVDLFRKNELSWLLVGNPTEDASAGAAIYYEDTYILDMIEKPPKTAPKTDLNNAGCYIFPSEIFHLLENTHLSPRGEIELTAPIIDRIHQKKPPYLIKMRNDEFWCDVGTIPVLDKLNQDKSWLSSLMNIKK
jgi:NDP-sugar pyrophosphorylase family protein